MLTPMEASTCFYFFLRHVGQVVHAHRERAALLESVHGFLIAFKNIFPSPFLLLILVLLPVLELELLERHVLR